MERLSLIILISYTLIWIIIWFNLNKRIKNLMMNTPYKGSTHPETKIFEDKFNFLHKAKNFNSLIWIICFLYFLYDIR